MFRHAGETRSQGPAFVEEESFESKGVPDGSRVAERNSGTIPKN